MSLEDVWGLIKGTIKEWNEDKAPRLAAALAYYTIFSIAPLLVLVIAIIGFIIGNNSAIRAQVIYQVQVTVGQQGANAVKQLIQHSSVPQANIVAAVIGIITLLLGATGLFSQLVDALNTIWDVKPKPNRGIWGLIKDRFLSFTMVLGICFLLLVSLVISAALAILNLYFNDLFGGIGLIAQTVNFLVSTAVITLVFGLIFKILPDVAVRWKDVWIGALVTALLFQVGKAALGIYLGRSAVASAYGAAGSLVILLLWVNYSAQILFLGAEFTQVYARRFGSRPIPKNGAVPIDAGERAAQGLQSDIKQRLRARQTAQTPIPIMKKPDLQAPERMAVEAPRELLPRRERMRYEPPDLLRIVPVIALGAVAAILTVKRFVRRFLA